MNMIMFNFSVRGLMLFDLIILNTLHKNGLAALWCSAPTTEDLETYVQLATLSNRRKDYLLITHYFHLLSDSHPEH